MHYPPITSFTTRNITLEAKRHAGLGIKGELLAQVYYLLRETTGHLAYVTGACQLRER